MLRSKRLQVGCSLVLLAVAAAVAVPIAHAANEIGDDFQISDMGPAEDDLYFADEVAVAYNSTDDEYLVVWIANDDGAGLDPDELEVYGQRISASTGLELGSNDFRISHVGTDGDPDFGASSPAVAYNPVDNEYLVVWEGNGNASQELEIYGQRLAADGTEIGSDFRISDMGTDGVTSRAAFTPAVFFNQDDEEYLVVWSGDDAVDNEFEIWGQRLDADGNEVGTNDFRISDMGVDGTTNAAAFGPDLAYNSTDGEYLVVWYGDDPTAPLADNEFEIFGQRLSAAGAEVGSNDFRISDMGPDGTTTYAAAEPEVAYNSQDNEYLVVWSGDDNTAPLVDNEREIFGQLLDATGSAIGSNDFRISDMGVNGLTAPAAFDPAASYDFHRNEYLVAWNGDDGLVPPPFNEFEVFGQTLDADGAEIDTNDFAISDMGGGLIVGFAGTAASAYAGGVRQFLVVWSGSDDDVEQEIFGQRLGNCGGGTLEPGEECEAPFDDCCDPFTCTYKTAGTECRAPSDLCDAAEQCSGTSAACPADLLAAAGVVCRPLAGACDLAEECDGLSAVCPSDEIIDDGSVCRPVAGDCDVAETCDGSGAQCPEDEFEDSDTVCRPVGGVCDVAETCTGSGAACPGDGFAGGETTCRPAVDVCDVTEACDGSGVNCPADLVADSSVVCRSVAGLCDQAETCPGIGVACPVDTFLTSGVCRPAAGDCDVADSCDGSGAACPANVVIDGGTTCRPSAGDCDLVEACDGVDAQCPADQLVSGGTVCRAVADVCDIAEECTGSSVACPDDAFAGSELTCRPVADVCDVAEVCSGSAASCPTDLFVDSSVVCRAVAGICDQAETCTGGGAACPGDAFLATGVCRPAAGDCDVADSCDGSGAACPADVVVDGGTTCRPAAGDCDVAETCDGVGTQCPVDQLASVGTVCRPVADLCDVAELCTGSQVSCPEDAFASGDVTCRPVAGVCDLAELCTGGEPACPVDLFVGNETVCRPAAPNSCDATETCSGDAADCPSDGDLPDFAPCLDEDICTAYEYCLAGVCTPTHLPGCGESFLGYKAKAPKKDASGIELAGNQLAENFVITLDDALLDGDQDDPENFLLSAPQSMLTAAAIDDGSAVVSQTGYVRYRAKGAKETIGPANPDGTFPKAARHIKRVWQLDTDQGAINVLSKGVKSVLIPAGLGGSMGAVLAADTTHYVCYGIKVTKDVTAQTPSGKFDKFMQAFVEAPLFDDCATDASGAPAFDGTSLEGTCLYGLRKPVELCNPVHLSSIEPPRMTSAMPLTDVEAQTTQSLLCYSAKLATKLTDLGAASLIGGSVGQSLLPKQSKALPHQAKRGNPVHVDLDQLPAPYQLDSGKGERVCIPATVADVTVAD